jgi:S1-C subfamily serine protease
VNKRVLRILGVLAALGVVFVIGAAAGGGVVFAATKAVDGGNLIQAITPQADTEEPGVVIASVAPDSPAAEAGVKRGDILLEIKGQAVNSPMELTRLVHDAESGGRVELALLHGDERRMLSTTLGEKNGLPYLGIFPCGRLHGDPAVFTMRLDEAGARIVEVVPDSPAQEAGLEVGDLVLAVDGQELVAEDSLADLIAEYEPGDNVKLTVKSPGEEVRELSIQLGNHPEAESVAFLGVRYIVHGPHLKYGPRSGSLPFGEAPFQMRPFEDEDFFTLPDGEVEQGAVVHGVTKGSPAEEAGLRPGDIITTVDDEPLAGPNGLVDRVAERQPGEELNLTVYRPDEEDTIEIETILAEHPEEEGKAFLGVLVGRFFRIYRFEGDHRGPLHRGLERRFKHAPPFEDFDFDFEFERDFEFRWLPDDCCEDGIGTSV